MYPTLTLEMIWIDMGLGHAIYGTLGIGAMNTQKHSYFEVRRSGFDDVPNKNYQDRRL